MHDLLHDDGFWTAFVVAIAGSILVIVLNRRGWYAR